MSANSNLDSRNIEGLAGYPSSGAYAHLPIRKTITGDAIASHPNANKVFLRNLPSHCYRLPNVPLNFTLVEIIVLLPNWFKNRAIASRFMNNCLTANVHFAIFEEHRYCNFASDHEREKAKKTITDEYRKTMRSIQQNTGWTKAKHSAPLGWDPMLLSMDGFVPDDTQFNGYLHLPPVLFQDLINGVTKLPEGDNAGDLTRAVQFTLNCPENLVFPDDLPRILEHIGRTQITMAHTDRSVVRVYADHMRKNAEARRPKRDCKSGSSVEERAARENAHEVAWHMLSQQATANVAQQYSHHQPSATISPPNGQAAYHQGQTAAHSFEEEMDALLRPLLTQEASGAPIPPANPSPLYHHRHLLRECIEGNVGFDGSPLARAAQFAQQPEQIGTEWYVVNVPWLVQLLDSVVNFEVDF